MSDQKKAPSKRTSKKVSMQQFAADQGVAERKLRRVARSLGMGVGRGERYELTAADRKRLAAKLSK